MNMAMNKEVSMPGCRVREGHASTVLSIVGKDLMLPVVSSGTGFFMRGSFGWRTVASLVCRGSTDAEAIASSTGGHTAAMINVAECGDEVSLRTYLALIGGAAHEAFHRVYSQQGRLTAAAVAKAIKPAVDNRSVDWSKRTKLVLDLQNVFEDIAIERIGNAEFPGVRTKLCDLADFIVRMESASRLKAGNPAMTPANAVFVALRDIGLGYNTLTVRENLLAIKAECPDAFGMVVGNGALASILRRSIPDVSSPAAIAAAKADLLAGSALTLALEAVAILDATGLGNPPPQSGEGEGDKSKGDKGDKGDKGSEGEGSEGEGSEGEGSPDTKGKAKGKGGKPSAKADADGEGEGTGPSDGKPSDSTSTGGGSGGGAGTSKETAAAFLEAHANNGKGAMDSSEALEAGVKSELAAEPATYETAPYRPLTTSYDEVVRVKAQPAKAEAFADLVKGTRKATGYLRSRLSLVFRALESGGIEHGVKVGPVLSQPNLVHTYCELRGGEEPSRAYAEISPEIDMSLAAVTVIDESSSMRDKLRETAAIAYTLGDALDGIGAKALTVGFRTKSLGCAIDYNPAVRYHREHAISYDLFKDWSESFRSTAPRLREIKATGGTPMADGVEFALKELSKRPEGHRVIFVITDGEPDPGARPVVNSQLRRAAEAGILVVGVGLGYGSAYVQNMFPDFVYSTNLDTLPKELVKKLEELVRKRHSLAKRGKVVKSS